MPRLDAPEQLPEFAALANAGEPELRNIANTEELASFVANIAMDKLGPEDVRDTRQASSAKWLSTVGRKAIMKSGQLAEFELPDNGEAPAWILKAIEEGRPVHQLVLGREDRSLLERSVDWLLSDSGPALGSDWSRVSLPAALESEQKWIAAMAAQANDVKHDAMVALQTRPVQGLEDLGADLGEPWAGFGWVELTGKASLAREGGLMGHCVGIFSQVVADNIYRIFSLRDAHNAPHATVAVKGAFFREIKMRHNQAASAFALAAVRPLMESLLPSMRALGAPVSASSDFDGSGYATTMALGFADYSKPLGEGARVIVERWRDMFGSNPKNLHSAIFEAIEAGSPELVQWLRPENHDSMLLGRKALLLALKKPRLLGLAAELVASLKIHDKGAIPKGTEDAARASLAEVVASSIHSGSSAMWAIASGGSPDAPCLLFAAGLAARACESGALAQFVDWIPESGLQGISASDSLASAACEKLAQGGRLPILQSLLLRGVELPWGLVAKGFVESENHQGLAWALAAAPSDARFDAALPVAVSSRNRAAVDLLLSDGRCSGGLVEAIDDAVCWNDSHALGLLASAAASSGPEAVQRALAPAIRRASGHRLAASMLLASLLEDRELFAECVRRCAGLGQFAKSGFEKLCATECEMSDQFRGNEIKELKMLAEKLLAQCLEILDPEDMLTICKVEAKASRDAGAAAIWRSAASMDGFADLNAHELRAAAIASGSDRLYSEMGGTARPLIRAGMTIEKAMRLGSWGFASMLADAGYGEGQTLDDALIYAAHSASAEAVRSLLGRCDAKRSNSQALVAAVQAGRVDVAEILAPISDPNAQSAEPLRSACAQGSMPLVELLLPLTDARIADSNALREAASLGHWEIAKRLWEHSDPNAGAGAPLASAAKSGRLDIATWMIERGANPAAGSSKALSLALAAGAAPAALPNGDGSRSAEALAVDAMAEALWPGSVPADLRHADLMAAIKANRPEWVARIVLNVNPSYASCAALRLAAKMGELELMEILLPISDPVRAASIVQAEGFGPDSEAMLLGMISKPARRPAP